MNQDARYEKNNGNSLTYSRCRKTPLGAKNDKSFYLIKNIQKYEKKTQSEQGARASV